MIFLWKMRCSIVRLERFMARRLGVNDAAGFEPRINTCPRPYLHICKSIGDSCIDVGTFKVVDTGPCMEG